MLGLGSQQQGDRGPAPGQSPLGPPGEEHCTPLSACMGHAAGLGAVSQEQGNLVRWLVILRVLPNTELRGQRCHVSLFLQGPVKGPRLSANALLLEPSVASTSRCTALDLQALRVSVRPWDPASTQETCRSRPGAPDSGPPNPRHQGAGRQSSI